MKIKHLLWASILPMAFAACQQEEAVMTSESNNNAAVEVPGSRAIENPIFSLDKDDAESRMVAPNGNVEWANGDKVGLAWLNAYEIGKKWDGVHYYSDWMPTYKLIGSNTRITYTGENSTFSMQDGQLFEGQYICYYPYNDDIKRVDQFYFNQAETQTQATSAVDGKNEAPFAYIANNLNWLSRETCGEAGDMNGISSFLYHIDSQRSGLVENIHIEMRRYSNIAEFRFNGVEPTSSSVKWEDLTIKSFELIATNKSDGKIFPTLATFDFSNGGDGNGDVKHLLALDGDNNYVASGETETTTKGDIQIWEKNEKYWKLPYYVGKQQVGNSYYPALTGGEDEKYVVNDKKVKSLQLNVENPAIVGDDADIQRAMFLTLPIVPSDLENTAFSIKINTNYGYVVIDESDWKKYLGKDADPVVNGTNWVDKNEFADYNALKTSGQTIADLLSLIGQKVTRYVAINPDNLTYNNIIVNNTNELVAAIAKWNALGKSGEFTVLACDKNKFDDLDWADDSETSDEIVKFLSERSNKLIFGTNNSDKNINFGGNTNFNSIGTLNFSAPIVIADGALTVEQTQELAYMTTMPGSNLIIKSGAYLNNTIKSGADYTLIGNTTIEQNARLHNSNLINEGVLTTNGNVMAEKFENRANAEYHVKTFSTVNVNTFENEGEVYYDQQCALFNNLNNNTIYITNQNNGRVIATINEGDDANTLSDYILAANRFKCTDLVLNNNDYFTSNQWDTSLGTVARFGFVRVKMNDGVKLNFLKGVDFGLAEVEIAENASVEWTRHSENQQTDAPTFTIKKLVVKGGATLNVSGIKVNNSQITDMVMGGEGVTTALIGTSCFTNTKTQTITTEHGYEGTLIVK